MIKIRRRIAMQAVVVGGILLVIASSYLAGAEGVVGKNANEIVAMAVEKNDYKVAQRVYETDNVLGAQIGAQDLETLIYPEMKIAAEIARVQELLEAYPTYPPLLRQLAELNRLAGNNDAAKEYEQELERLKVSY